MKEQDSRLTCRVDGERADVLICKESSAMGCWTMVVASFVISGVDLWEKAGGGLADGHV